MFLLSDGCCFRITPLDVCEGGSLIKAPQLSLAPSPQEAPQQRQERHFYFWCWAAGLDLELCGAMGALVAPPNLAFKSQLCCHQLGDLGQVVGPLSSLVSSSRTISDAVMFKENLYLMDAPKTAKLCRYVNC